MDEKAAIQISLNHNVHSSKEKLKDDTNFLTSFLFVHFLSSDFMFVYDPCWLVQEAYSVQLYRQSSLFCKFTAQSVLELPPPSIFQSILFH